MTGLISYHAGLAAEDQVAHRYERDGQKVVNRRWRGQGGEIDLILQDGATVIFVEVKRAATHAAALARVSARQIQRIFDTAGEYLATMPAGLLTETRFDVVTVDAHGTIQRHKNALI